MSLNAESQTPLKHALRCPSKVMRLARLGSFHQTRLSFMRILLRRLQLEEWRFECKDFDIDARGVGYAVYTMHGPSNSYSLIAFGNDLDPKKRSDRVIATEWDATFALFDGIPSSADIERLSGNIPKQEAGRVEETELTVSRANRSVRLFDYVIDCLSSGKQPDPDKIDAVGYLMRTTAVYGSGKLGAADREMIANRPEFKAPFQAEMLTVFLIRAFVLDLVEHMAKARNPDQAVVLDATLRRRFGIGNSTGLGMAPFLLNHPVLINNWIKARETALSRVLSLERVRDADIDVFYDVFSRSRQNVADWVSEHPLQIEKLNYLKADLEALEKYLVEFNFSQNFPWRALWDWADGHVSVEGQELLVSLFMEPYGDLVDPLADEMSADENDGFIIDGSMLAGQLCRLLEDIYDWALKTDWDDPASQARAWYISEEKLEPRLGERFEEPVSAYEQPLAPGRDAARLYADLKVEPGEMLVAGFLLRHPEHRHIVRRVQIASRYPYAEIRDNTISAEVLPIDLLRAKLSFFGAGHFDPRSDRWVRINMFRNAPFPHEIKVADFSGWIYPTFAKASG